MSYFKLFPNVRYDFSVKTDKTDIIDVVQDMMLRSSLYVDKKDVSLFFMPYTVQEGETPEIIAYNLYGDPQLHWVVMFVNHVFDIYNDWPLPMMSLYDYCVNKYGADKLDRVHHWEILPDQMEVGSVVYSDAGVLQKELSGLVFNTLNGVDTYIQYVSDVENGNDFTRYEFATYTNYEYEIRENEIKRYIKVIRPAFIAEFVKLFNASLL